MATSSLNAENKPSWPIRALRSLSKFNPFSGRIEPEVFSQGQKIEFTRYGLMKTVKTKSGTNQFADIGGSGNQFVIERPGASVPINAEKALANNKGFVYAAVNAKAREVLAIDFRLFQVKGDEHEEQKEHEVLDLLDAVNDNMTSLEFKYLLSACLDITGSAYLFLEGVKNDLDKPKAIHLMPPDKVTTIVDRRSWPFQLVGYKMKLENGKEMAFQPYEVIHFRLPNPANFFEGMSPVAAAAEYIDNDNDAWEFNRKFFRNGARPAGFLKTPFVSETQLETLQVGFASMHQGVENANRIGVLPKDVDWVGVGSNPKDMDFKNLSQESKERILMMFGTSKTILGTAESDTNRACYDDQTEVLTENGWKKYYEVNDDEKIAEYDGESNVVRFAKPLGKYVYHYKGKMLHFENSKMDIMVTPDHRMWYRPDHKGAKYRIAQAEKLPKVCYFKAAAPQYEGYVDIPYFNLPGYKKGSHPENVCRGFAMDDWLEFLGYVISEGGVSSQVRNRVITLYQKKQPHLAKIRRCLQRLKASGCLNYGSYRSPGENGTRFNVYGAPLIFWMHENIGSYANEKHIPEFVFRLSPRQRRIVFDALMLGDGSIDPKQNARNGYYSTTSHQLADDVQRLAFSLGIQAHVAIHYEANGNRNTCYRVMFDFGMTESLINANRDGYRTEVDYDGVVWCFKTTTGLFVTRRNGKIALQGNTAETADYVFSKRVIKPHMMLICAFLNERLIPRYGDDLYISFIDPVPEDRAARKDEMVAAVGGQPIMNIDEARDMFLGLGPIPGGDTLMKPNTMGPADATAEADAPEATPAPPKPQKAANGLRVAYRPTRTKLQKRAEQRNRMKTDLATEIRKALSDLAANPTKKFKSTKENDEVAWVTFKAQTESTEKQIEGKIREVNAAQKKEVLEHLPAAIEKAVDPKKLFDVDKWISITIDAVTPALTKLYEEEATVAAAELDKPGLTPLSDIAAREALHKSIGMMAKSYNETTLATLETKINDGLSQGQSLAQISSTVEDIYQWSDTYRAERVSKTEAFRTSNMALKETWKQTGVVKTVRWYTSNKDNVCPQCLALDGKVISVDANFLNEGETMTADDRTYTQTYGDLSSPPAHPLCSCFLRPEDISI